MCPYLAAALAEGGGAYAEEDALPTVTERLKKNIESKLLPY